MRALTWAVVAGVGVIVVVAAVDALRGGGAAEPPAAAEPGEAESRALVPASLASRGLAGVLRFADRECRVRAYRLPDLEPVDVPAASACTAAPPDERAAAVRDGELLDESGRVVVSGRDLEAALDPPVVRSVHRYRVSEAIWLDPGRAIALVGVELAPRASPVPPAGFLVCLLDVDRNEATVLDASLRASGLSVSPHAGYAAATVGHRLRLYGLGVGAGVLPLAAELEEVHAVAWSPDERWLAAAARGTVYFVSTDEPGRPPALFPLAARDLAWS